jgi:hypothetical protein
MTEEQAEKIVRELRAIKLVLCVGLLLAVSLFSVQRIVEAVAGPPPPPTVSVQPGR